MKIHYTAITLITSLILLILLVWIEKLSFGSGVNVLAFLGFYLLIGIGGYITVFVNKNSYVNLLVIVVFIAANGIVIEQVAFGNESESWSDESFSFESEKPPVLSSSGKDDKSSLYHSSTPRKDQVNVVNAVDSELDSLTRDWTWDEQIEEPTKSLISNFSFDKKYLFQAWGNKEDKTSILFEFDAIAFCSNELNYKYTLHHDSLRIFTKQDILDGVERGIVKFLNKDSLIIQWSNTEKTSAFYSIAK